MGSSPTGLRLSPAAHWAPYAAAGAAVAAFSAGVSRLPYIWAALLLTGMSVAVFSLTAKNFKSYWLAVFALTLPLDIKKMLIDSDMVREVTGLHGIPLGELPGPILYLSDLPFLVLMAVWAYEIMHRRQKVFFPPGHWFAIGFLAWAALSLAKAPVFLYGIFDLLRTFKFYLLYLFIANNIRSRGELRVLANALLFGVIVQGVICVYQYLAQDVSHVFGNLFGQQDMYSEETVKAFKSFFTVAPGTDLKRASGTVGPINAEAQYFEFLLPAAFVLWATAGRFLRRAFRFAALAAGLVGLVVTFSRGGLIGVTVGLAVALFLSRRYGLISSRKFAAYVVAALMAAVLLTPKFYQYTMTRPEAALARFHLNKVGLDMIKSHPLLGVGLNNHIVVKPEYDPESYMFPTPTHNHYLVVASEVGVPGLVLFSGFIVVCFLSALKAGRAIAPLEAAVGVGIAGAIAAISVHNLVDHLSYHTNLTMLWLLAGLAPALVRADGLAGAPAEAP